MNENQLSWDYATQHVANALIERYRNDTGFRHRSFVPSEVSDTMFVTSKDDNTFEILQLFCGFGLEAIHISRTRSAKVTGVDFSKVAIQTAEKLLAIEPASVRFVQSDYLDYLDQTNDRFDLIFTSLGSLWWIEDLSFFFERASEVLRANGKILIWDFHPITNCIDDEQRVFRCYPAESERYSHEHGIINYLAEKLDLSANLDFSYQNDFLVSDYRHSLEGIISGCINPTNGLQISCFKELFDTYDERYFLWQTLSADGRWVAASDYKRLPIAFVMLATKNERY